MKLNTKNVKTWLLACGFGLFATGMYAQAPQKFNYQGIARDLKGNPMGKQQLGLKISVLPTEDATQPEYEETQLVSTNEFGLYTLQIGNGTPLTGKMETVKWETGNKYIRVAIDPAGGQNYTDAGTTQLLSVPYAIYADKAGIAKQTVDGTSSHGGTRASNNYIEKTSATGVANSNSLLYDNGTNIGLNTTSPAASFHVYKNSAVVQEHLRMQNASTTGAGRFTMYNDGASAYATFTKYGSAYAGGYTGVTTLYPYANLLAFGNNGLASGDGLGRFLISTAGNAGISLFKGGTSKLKFHADFTSENVGIGGNSAPVARVHLNNTDGTTMNALLTNNTTGHTATDGLEIKNTGNAASIVNRENDILAFGTNNTERARIDANGNVGINTTSPLSKLHINAVNDSALLAISTISEDSTTGNYLSTGSTLGLSPLTYGMIGQVTNGDWGAGIFGRGYGSSPLPFTGRDVGVYGSANYLGNAIGVLGNSENGTAVMGLSSNGYASYFKSPSGLAVLADSGNVIVKSGRLGVGTISPTQRFVLHSGPSASGNFIGHTHILGAVSSMGNALVSEANNTGNDAPSLQFSRTLLNGWQNTPLGLANYGIWANVTGVGTGGYAGIFTRGMDADTATKYIGLVGQDPGSPTAVFMGGNIGIGTTTPTRLLDVNGSSFFNDSMVVSNNFGRGRLRLGTAGNDQEIQFYRGLGSYGMRIRTTVFGETNFEYSNDGWQTYATRLKIGALDNYVLPGDDGVTNLGYPGNRWAGVYTYGLNTQTLDANTINTANVSTYGLSTNSLQVNFGASSGAILTSDASGNATWNTAAKGTLATSNFVSNMSNIPNGNTGFLVTPASVTITSSTQVVFVTSSVALGAGSTAASNLNLFIGYNSTGSVTPVTTAGGGSYGYNCAANTRNNYTLSARITGLAPGTYYFGLVGSSTSPNWVNNEYGYTTVQVFN